ncbi:MAG: ATP-binding cassette domain-containing protein [Bdellovibrionales bacterium]|nr:ATP-binding cassette domain-containing protein [Ramlibacter sp.]
MSGRQPVFELSRAGVRFGTVQALVDASVRVVPGERLALVGANGSGKSTLLRLLHGLLAASSGSVTRDGLLRQAMLFQRPHMLRTSAQNNVALGLWLAGQRWREARMQALQALARVGLQDVAARNGRTLSGGQQQRLALARAWALRPDVLLLDEPTASLDPHAKREVEALMAQFAESPHANAVPGSLSPWERAGVRARAPTPHPTPHPTPLTMVFSSHNLGQVKRLASRVIYLEQGHIVADLPVHDFFNGPLPEAARLFVKGEAL